MNTCHSIGLELESRDPTLIPGILKSISELLQIECDRSVQTPSWSIHACMDLLVRVTPFFPSGGSLTLSAPVVRVVLEGSDPQAITKLVSLILGGLEKEFPGQVYSRLSP